MAGLAKWPGNLRVGPPSQPFRLYRPEQLLEALRQDTAVPLQTGTYRYSTYGISVLGAALGLCVGGSYEAACRQLVIEPLGLDAAFLPASQTRRTETWRLASTRFGSFAPAGGLLLSAEGVATFLAACLVPLATPLAAALGAAETIRAPTGRPGHAVAQGWHVRHTRGRAIYWHNGRTPRGRAFVGYSPHHHRGAAVLAGFDEDWDDLGFALVLGKSLGGSPVSCR